jgi:hypothetical protein
MQLLERQCSIGTSGSLREERRLRTGVLEVKYSRQMSFSEDSKRPD